jgi:hypothetical protein
LASTPIERNQSFPLSLIGAHSPSLTTNCAAMASDFRLDAGPVQQVEAVGPFGFA